MGKNYNNSSCDILTFYGHFDSCSFFNRQISIMNTKWNITNLIELLVVI